ncbi:MAG: hypothetical protein ABSC33_18490 [Candidatus Sulfotelmatobacter sp.]|jgi:hypothetical protein
MPDQKPSPPPPSAPPSHTPPSAAQRGPTIHIGDEFGTAKRNLPPAKVVLLALAGVVVIVAAVAFLQRPKPQATGTLVNIASVQLPGQNAVLVALTFALRNPGAKSLWVHDIKGKLATTGGEVTAEAVSAVDFDRYFSAFPALKTGAQPALAPEDKLQPGQEISRTVILSFPVSLDSFNQRRSISVIVQPYDQPVPVTLTQ